MTDIALGAYETEAEAQAAMTQRKEPAEQLEVMQVLDPELPSHPYRIVWHRPE